MSERVRVGDHVTIAKGKPPAHLPYGGPGALPYLTPDYLRGQGQPQFALPGQSAVLVSEADAVLLWDGSNAGEFFQGKAGIAASTMARLQAGPGFERAYFIQVLKHAERFLKSQTSGTGIPHVDREVLEDIVVFRPAVPEQRAIALVLDTLDTTIRQTEAIIEKLKQVKQGLLHDLLTRGIDANGELRPPQSEAPHLYKASPLGWIPCEWNASSVASEFDVTSGLTLGPHRTPQYRPRKYLRVANVQRYRIDLTDVAELDATDAEMRTRQLLPGDLLIVEGHASTDEIGRCAMADEAVRGYTFQNHLFRLRAVSMDETFALYWMNSDFVRAYWRVEAATSSGLNTINRTKLDRLLAVVPPLKEQKEIVVIVKGIELRLELEQQQLAKLTAQKSGLMDDLLTGRVRVTSLLAQPTGT